MTGIQLRDAVTGGVVAARHDGHHIVIAEDGVDILHLNTGEAITLANRILDAVVSGGARMTGSVVDGRDASPSVLVAQDLLDYVASRDLLAGLPGQPGPELGGDDVAVAAGEPHAADASGEYRRAVADFFEVLLDRAVQVETDLAERGNVYRTGLDYGMATTVDDNGELHSAVSAIVDHDGGTIIIDLEQPLVRNVVLCDVQRPAGDRVRVASEFVRIYRDALCLLGLPDTVRGKVVGGLGEAVAVLSDLVRGTGSPNSCDRDHRSGDPGGGADAGNPVTQCHEVSPSFVGDCSSVGEGAGKSFHSYGVTGSFQPPPTGQCGPGANDREVTS